MTGGSLGLYEIGDVAAPFWAPACGLELLGCRIQQPTSFHIVVVIAVSCKRGVIS